MPVLKEKSLVRLVPNLQGEENESIWIDSKRIDNRRIDADLPDAINDSPLGVYSKPFSPG